MHVSTSIMVGDDEITVAAAFLAPVIQRGSLCANAFQQCLLMKITESFVKARGESMLNILDCDEGDDRDQNSNTRYRVISKALLLLLSIHHALCQRPINSPSSDVLRDLKSRRITDGLLDLIFLEGIYPSLSPGVGIPIERRVRSVLKGSIVTRISAEHGQEMKDKTLLIKITESLTQIATSKENGLGPALQDRTLVDLIAGLGELAYNPTNANEEFHLTNAEILKDLLDAYVACFQMR